MIYIIAIILIQPWQGHNSNVCLSHNTFESEIQSNARGCQGRESMGKVANIINLLKPPLSLLWNCLHVAFFSVDLNNACTTLFIRFFFFLNKTTLPELGYLFSNILALCTSTANSGSVRAATLLNGQHWTTRDECNRPIKRKWALFLQGLMFTICWMQIYNIDEFLFFFSGLTLTTLI